MALSQILGATFEDGLKAPHYINRRLLTAEDLKAEQQATLARLALLGKAAGYGIVEGLEVELLGTIMLRVNAGLGVTRSGNPIRLPRATPLSFTAPPASSSTNGDAGRFHECNISTEGSAGVPNIGAYLLTVAPVSRLEGSAPVQAAAGTTTTPACAAQWELEGLQFRAIRLDGFDNETGVNNLNRRNRLAHWCYDSAGFPDLERDYLNMPEQWGGLSQLSAQDLTACDLPLAVFYWNGSVISDLDLWSVRRRLIHSAALSQFSGLTSDRRAAEGMARWLQFQTQLAALLVSSTSAPSAPTSFPLLPPAGLLRARLPEWLLIQVALELAQAIVTRLSTISVSFPIFGISIPAMIAQFSGQIAGQAVQATTQTGIDLGVFFANRTLRFGLIETDTIDEIVHQSWYRNAFPASGNGPIEILVPAADVARLLAPGLRTAVQSVANFFANFGVPANLFVSEAEIALRAWIAERNQMLADRVTLTQVQPVVVFTKVVQPTQYVNNP